MRDEKNLDLEKRVRYNKLIHWKSLLVTKGGAFGQGWAGGAAGTPGAEQGTRMPGIREVGLNGHRDQGPRSPDERFSSELTEVTIAEGGCGGEHANV